MSVREKLVELLNTNACPSPFMCDPACRYYGFEDCFPDRFADHLIAHGVTVQEWIPVEGRTPGNTGLYLVIEKHWLDGSLGIKIAKWNTVDWFTADRKSKKITPRVTHWMPLPPLPKGE